MFAHLATTTEQMVTAGHKRKMSRLAATTFLKMLSQLQEVRTSKGIKIARLVPKLSMGGPFVSHPRVIPFPKDFVGKFMPFSSEI